MKRKPKFLGIGLTLRASPIFTKQLEALVKKLGENKSRVVVRAIGEAYERHVNKQQN